MNEQDIIKYFSQIIWKEANRSVGEKIPYNVLQNSYNNLLLLEGNVSFAWQFLFHYCFTPLEEDIELNGSNAVIVNLKKKRKGDMLCIRGIEKCIEVCQIYNIQNIIIVKPHIHSLDLLYLETLLYDTRKGIKGYVYAYEADELYLISDAERHVQSLQLYWKMLEWFEKSELKQEYVREYESSELK